PKLQLENVFLQIVEAAALELYWTRTDAGLSQHLRLAEKKNQAQGENGSEADGDGPFQAVQTGRKRGCSGRRRLRGTAGGILASIGAHRTLGRRRRRS